MRRKLFKMNANIAFVISYFLLLQFVVSQKHIDENNNSIKQQVESAGCPYHDQTQLLREGICLMPHYQANDPPEKSDKKIKVDIDYYEIPQVLEIDERKNKIVLDIMQHMEWKDPRIKFNFSGIPNMMLDGVSHSKFSPAEVSKIWHPNLDSFTYNLQDWKYLYDPFWYQSLGILKCPTLRDCDSNEEDTTLYANKHWIVTLFCKFNFSKFPMDTHHCSFRQILGSTSEIVDLFLYPQTAKLYRNNKPKMHDINQWNYEISDFKISVKPIGTLIMQNETVQNANRDFGFDVQLTRIFEPYLYQIYLPCFAIVIVSLISFLIPLTAIPGRVTLIVTIFLTITHIFMKQLVRNKKNNFYNSHASMISYLNIVQIIISILFHTSRRVLLGQG